MIERWIARHWAALCIGCVLTGIAVRVAYMQRGHVALGGEWLIIPAAFVVDQFVRAARKANR